MRCDSARFDVMKSGKWIYNYKVDANIYEMNVVDADADSQGQLHYNYDLQCSIMKNLRKTRTETR